MTAAAKRLESMEITALAEPLARIWCDYNLEELGTIQEALRKDREGERLSSLEIALAESFLERYEPYRLSLDSLSVDGKNELWERMREFRKEILRKRKAKDYDAKSIGA